MRKSRSGFTLTELIIGVSLSAVVLVGIIGISAQMIRFHMQGARKGDVTGWTLLGLQRFNRELENTTMLDCPRASTMPNPTSPTCLATGPGARLIGCTNFTRQTNPPFTGYPIDDTKETVAYMYCVPTAGAYKDHLLRYAQVTTGAGAVCPPNPMPTCGNNPAGGQTMDVVVKGFYDNNGASVGTFFTRADDVSGVRLTYTVGLATATAEISPTAPGPTPFFMRFDTKVGMNKSYSNELD